MSTRIFFVVWTWIFFLQKPRNTQKSCSFRLGHDTGFRFLFDFVAHTFDGKAFWRNNGYKFVLGTETFLKLFIFFYENNDIFHIILSTLKFPFCLLASNQNINVIDSNFEVFRIRQAHFIIFFTITDYINCTNKFQK